MDKQFYKDMAQALVRQADAYAQAAKRMEDTPTPGPVPIPPEVPTPTPVPPQSPQIPTPIPPGKGSLYVRGNKIMFGDQPFTIRGTSIFEVGADDSGEYLDLFLRDFPNANTMRLPITPIHPIHPGGWVGFRGGLVPYFNRYLKPAIEKMAAQGKYSIIDWHVIQPWFLMMDKCLDFWKEILPLLETVSRPDLLIFEIFNEPKNGQQHQQADFKTALERVVDYIRGAGWDNHIIMPSHNWDKMIKWWPDVINAEYAEQRNVSFCYHLYNYNRMNWGNENPGEEIFRLSPVSITEVGWTKKTDPKGDEGHYGTNEDFGEWARSIMDKAGNVTAWCQHHASKPPLYDPNRQLDDTGKWFQEYLS